MLTGAMSSAAPSRPRGSEDLWLNAAAALLCEAGVDAVMVAPLAQRLGLSRTGFYWHFKDRKALLDALLMRWETRTTRPLLARADAYAETICEALFNLCDCWLDRDLFDARMELAVRDWARADPAVAERLAQADATRRAAIAGLFRHFGYPETEAETRTLALLQAQIGYFALPVDDTHWMRIARIPDFVEIFSGRRPVESEVGRFMARHIEERVTP